MGAFGSCLGVARPFDIGVDESRFLGNEVPVLRALLNVGDLRHGVNNVNKMNNNRNVGKPNSYFSSSFSNQNPRRNDFNVAQKLGLISSKNNVVKRLFRQTAGRGKSKQKANNLNKTQANLVDFDDHPHSPLSNNGQHIPHNKLNNHNGISNNLSTSILSNNQSIDQITNQRTNNEESKILIALYDYEPRTKEDLAIRKGEHLVAISLEPNGLWWMAQSKSTKQIGYVPTNYVAELKSLGAEPWYFGKIGRLEAENRLRSPENKDGSFIIRDAETNHNRYSLSLRHNNEVKHYRIKQFEEGGFFLIKKTIFSTLHDFVSHYSTHADGLCVELRQPCVSSAGLKPTTQGLSYDTCDQWEIDRKELVLLHELGHGQFGQVYEGLWKGKTPVAIKTLKRGTMDPQEFITEAQTMKNLRHDKLVQLYAVCTREEPIFIVTELMKNGCLLNYLQKNKQLELSRLIHIACQIAEGMAYLEAENYLHRDLAARNILVGDNNIVKIADFGLARLIKESEYEARPYSKCPIKWTSPESITSNRYTSKSDVWSFGIVLYEIITYGATPYPRMTNNEMLLQVEKGYRMPNSCMPNCPPKLYDIMLKCWNKDPIKRPTFEDLQHELDNYFIT